MYLAASPANAAAPTASAIRERCPETAAAEPQPGLHNPMLPVMQSKTIFSTLPQE